MKASDINLRKKYIVNLLRTEGGANFRRINEKLEQMEEIHGEKLTISNRHFARLREDIYRDFGALIEYDTSLRKYRITEENDPIEGDRFFETLDLVSIMQRGLEGSPYLHFDSRRPLGTELLRPILNAIIDRKRVQFNYQKFWEPQPTTRQVESLALKEAVGRWYLIGYEQEKIKTFGLDRITEFQTLTQKFHYPTWFSVKEHFKDCFGIIKLDNNPPTKVLLRCSKIQGSYLKNYPLHHSQKVVEETEKHILLELYVRPTYDFELEILGNGEAVEVLEPQWFRDRITYRIETALSHYK